MRKIYLLRHGHTPITGTYVGSTDCGLSKKGVTQIKEFAKSNRFLSIQHIIASPMLRCVQTVEHLNLDVPVEYHPMLREIDFGLWEGLTFAEVSEQYPEQCQKWFNHPSSFSFPDGESIPSFHDRVHNILPIIKRYNDKDLLVVAHGGVIRHLICLYLGVSFEKFDNLRLDVAHYAMLEFYDDHAVLAQLNRGVENG